MKPLLLEHPVSVRWSDQDVNGHVNNTLYFTYFEQARIAWLRDQKALNNTREGGGVVVAQASCNFLRALSYPETVEVRVYGGPVGRTSFTLFYEIVGSDGKTRYADGQTVMVWVDRSTGQSRPVPEFMRRALSS